jgi:hypothetical protein
MVRQNIVAHFLWCNKDYWESAQGPSLFGLLGVSFKRAWLNWVKEGVLSGDGWADEYGHFHKGKLKQEVRSDQALDYIANHEKTGPRSARRPDCSDYDGDVENAHGFYKWEAETGKREQIETDAYRTAPQEIETAQRLVNISDADPTNDGNPEIAVTRRCWRNLWLYKRPSSLGLGDFEEWIDPEVDIQRTFDHVYGVTKPSPVLLYQVPTSTVHQPNGFVRIGSRRAAQRAKRDAEVFIMRTCEDADASDIPFISSLSAREVAAAVKNLSDERYGEKIKKALRQGRTPVCRRTGWRSTGGAFGVPCAGAHVSMSASRNLSPRHGPCKVIVHDGVKLDQPLVLPVPLVEVDL